MVEKRLLHIAYNCGLKVDGKLLGPKDEWIIYSGKENVTVGDEGFGKITCYPKRDQSDKEVGGCHPNGGIIDLIETYSSERARQLGLEKTLQN